jgi:hypothetical protein
VIRGKPLSWLKADKQQKNDTIAKGTNLISWQVGPSKLIIPVIRIFYEI